MQFAARVRRLEHIKKLNVTVHLSFCSQKKAPSRYLVDVVDQFRKSRTVVKYTFCINVLHYRMITFGGWAFSFADPTF